jgi:hypothetical protein
MTNKPFKWHKRWTVDVEAASASHDSGLVVRFLALPLSEAQIQEHNSDAAIGKCWTTDGREWGVITTPALWESTFENLKFKNGVHNAQSMLARLAREAGEVWAWNKNKEH